MVLQVCFYQTFFCSYLLEDNNLVDDLFTEKPSFRKAPVDQIIMEGEAVHFPCEVVGDQPIVVEWRKENGALKFGRVRVLKDNTLRIEKAEAEDAGLYVCMASNSVGTAEAVARLTVQCKSSWL